MNNDSKGDTLVEKGNILHLLLLLLLLVFSFIYTVVTLFKHHWIEAFLSAMPMPFVIIEYYLFSKGYHILSKMINLFQITVVIGLISLATSPATGTMAFYIPILVGTQLTFMGNERKIAHYLTFYIFCALLFFLTTDIHIGPAYNITAQELKFEWIFNFVGAALATTLEIIFILTVSNRIQHKLFDHSDLLNKKNAELTKALQSNIESNQLITEQLDLIKKSETELEKLSLIATKTNSGVIITDALGKVEWVNNAFTSTTGYRLSDIIGKKPKDFLQVPDMHHPSMDLFHEKLSRNEYVEAVIPNIKKNGDVFVNQVEISPVFDKVGKILHFVSLQRDITAETNQKNEIVRINERFNQITTKGGIGIWVYETLGNTVTWNDILIDQYGADRKEVENDLFQFWKDSIHPDDKERVLGNTDKLYAGQISLVEDEIRIIMRDSKEVKFLKTITIAERDHSGSLIQMIGSSIDITAEKNMQLSISQKNIELQKANSELDKFVYSVSHDLRSPLLSLKGLLNLVFDLHQLDPKVKEYLTMGEKSISRLDETIKEILNYSRNARMDLQLEPFDFKMLLHNIFEDHHFIVKEGFEFKIDINGKEEIYSDKSRIQILLRNLIGNAVKYRNMQQDHPLVMCSLDQTENQIVITVSDNGLGISENSLPKIFDMFYRGSSSDGGTGLGLYICKQIVEKLEGSIEVNSKVNTGSTFIVKLPRKKSNPQQYSQ